MPGFGQEGRRYSFSFPSLIFPPVSCRIFLPLRTFTAQNTEVSGRNSAWLEFTASEDEPHARMVLLARRSRESMSSRKRGRESGDFRD